MVGPGLQLDGKERKKAEMICAIFFFLFLNNFFFN